MGRYIIGSTDGVKSELEAILRKENLHLNADTLSGHQAGDFVPVDSLESTILQNIPSYNTGVNKPTITSHANGNLLNNTTITSSPVNVLGDMSRYRHTCSDWEIATDINFNNIVNYTYKDFANRTEWRPENLLPNTDYYVRVRYYVYSNRSVWSDPIHVITSSGWVNLPKPIIVSRKGIHSYGGVPTIEINQNAANNLPSGVTLQNIVYNYLEDRHSVISSNYSILSKTGGPDMYSWNPVYEFYGSIYTTTILAVKYRTNKGDSGWSYKVVQPDPYGYTNLGEERMPLRLYGHSMFWLKHAKVVLIIGGYTGFGATRNWNLKVTFMDQYGHANKTYGSLPSGTLTRDGAMAVTTGSGGTKDILIIAGGDPAGGNTGVTSVKRWNITDGTAMSDIAPLPIPITKHKMAQFPDGDLIITGGYSNGVKNTATLYYDNSTNTWSTRASLPAWRHRFGWVADYNDRAIMFGGISDEVADYSYTVREIRIYDRVNDTWSVSGTDFAGNLNGGSNQHDYVPVLLDDGKIFIVSGTWVSNSICFWNPNDKETNVRFIAYLPIMKSGSSSLINDGPLAAVAIPGTNTVIASGGVDNIREILNRVHILRTSG